MQYNTNPATKGELVDRLLSQAFTGDLRELAADPRKVKIKRPKPHVVLLDIAGKENILKVQRPRDAATRASIRKKLKARRASKGVAPKKAPTESTTTKEKRGGPGRYAHH